MDRFWDPLAAIDPPVAGGALLPLRRMGCLGMLEFKGEIYFAGRRPLEKHAGRLHVAIEQSISILASFNECLGLEPRHKCFAAGTIIKQHPL